MKKQKCNIYYCRTFTSLLISLGYLFKFHLNKFNILILPSQSFKNNHFNRQIFLLIRPFLQEYFKQIKIVNYERKLKKKKFSFLNSPRSNSVKKNLNKIKINFDKFYVENVLSGGDDFESILIKKLGYIPNFYFTEHGDGNLASAISNNSGFFLFKKFLIKSFLISYLKKIFFLLNLNFFYPVRYLGYIGVLQKNITEKIYFNDPFSLNKININLYVVIKRLSDFILKQNIVNKSSNKKYILFNYSSISLSKNKEINFQLFKKLEFLIKKDHIVIFKGHPSYRSLPTDLFIKSFLIFLKKRNIKILVLNKNSLINNLPSQILVKLMNIKILISDISTSIFHVSNIFKNVNCYMPLNYSFNNRPDKRHNKENKSLLRYYKKIGKNINFI